jgi:hypothetical protein
VAGLGGPGVYARSGYVGFVLWRVSSDISGSSSARSANCSTLINHVIEARV